MQLCVVFILKISCAVLLLMDLFAVSETVDDVCYSMWLIMYLVVL